MRKKMLVSTFSLGLLGAALFGGIGIPALLSARELAESIVAKRGTIDQEVAVRLRQREQTEEIQKVKASIGDLGVLAVREGLELDFINAMERIRDAAGVEQTLSFDTTNVEKLSEWEGAAPLTVRVAGTYAQTVAYLRGLENLPFLIDIHELTMDGGRGEGDRIETTIGAGIYWQSSAAPDFTKPALKAR